MGPPGHTPVRERHGAVCTSPFLPRPGRRAGWLPPRPLNLQYFSTSLLRWHALTGAERLQRGESIGELPGVRRRERAARTHRLCNRPVAVPPSPAACHLSYIIISVAYTHPHFAE